MIGIHPHFPCSFFKTQEYFPWRAIPPWNFDVFLRIHGWKSICKNVWGVPNWYRMVHNSFKIQQVPSNNFKPQRHAQVAARPLWSIMRWIIQSHPQWLPYMTAATSHACPSSIVNWKPGAGELWAIMRLYIQLNTTEFLYVFPCVVDGFIRPKWNENSILLCFL